MDPGLVAGRMLLHLRSQTAEAVGIGKPDCFKPHPAAGSSALVHHRVYLVRHLLPSCSGSEKISAPWFSSCNRPGQRDHLLNFFHSFPALRGRVYGEVAKWLTPGCPVAPPRVMVQRKRRFESGLPRHKSTACGPSTKSGATYLFPFRRFS